ncbi:MAG: RRQRL motif-containing zinc-binding protein [Micromonosporaceae bacterium]
MRNEHLDKLIRQRGYYFAFYDPDGDHHGTPTYPWRSAPEGLATVRQLRHMGLRPGGQDVAAQILWRRGKRVAYLYRIDLAKPKREATPAQLVAINLALAARMRCPTCGQHKPYYIPRRYGECLDCAGVYGNEAAA